VSRRVLVVAPASVAGALQGASAEVRAYHTAPEAAAALQSPGWEAAVLLSDGIPPGDDVAVATVVRAAGRPVIEVRRERWDGDTWSPLSAACRGVIAGFGLAGVGAAIGVAAGEAQGSSW
jgi:hypothetical protein